MTLVARPTNTINASPRKTLQSSSLPRFLLRKRTVSGDGDDDFKLPTVTSAFLSGLFADVAQVQTPSVEPCSNSSTFSFSSGLENRPVKKSRTSLNHSMSRCERSFKNLSAVCSPDVGGATSASPTGVTEILTEMDEAPLIPRLSKHDSLHFQLCCVGYDASSSFDPDQTVLEAGELAFPNLPATVSNSSCSTNTLTRNLSDLQTSLTETHDDEDNNSNKEAYGWFVVVDDDTKDEAAVADPYATSTKLAFVAPTAPLATNQDDEVEWAKAADMVDDVLGDFF